ncbi:MAG: hypothetical protein VB115_01410 [Christensenellaceae bacterium]|nr:hypothetical protein [Christensenellaceae bacterium]
MKDTTRDISIPAKTLEDALREAQALGFEIAQTEARTYSIDGLLEELSSDDASESPCEYGLFNNVIIRLTGIGSRDAEVIQLD